MILSPIFPRHTALYYLCGGLIMECCVDALKHPFRLFAGPIHDGIVLHPSCCLH